MTGLPPPSAGDDAPPGAPAFNLAQEGMDACAGVSLRQVVAAVHQGWPELRDVDEQYLNEPNGIGDHSSIRAFAHDTGFALIFKRGSGDCPAGCLKHEYWYFRTDAACAPVLGGRYSAEWASDNCLRTSGRPMWGVPQSPDPILECGADNSPASIVGVYNLQGTGTRRACTEKAGAEPQVKATVSLTLSVAQDPGDLSRGTVTVQGTGHPLVDGQPIPAAFTRRRFTAAREVSNLPANCIDQHSIEIRHDFELGLPGHLELLEVRSINCPPSLDYCKGVITLDLTAAP